MSEMKTYKVTLVCAADEDVYVNVITDPSDFDPNASFLVLRFAPGATTYMEDDAVNPPPAMLAVRLDDVLTVYFH